jgi:hypothetical protein
MRHPRPARWGARAVVTAAVASAAAFAVRSSLASDHQDTPEVELSPQLDINDVYAFPGSTPDRIVLVLTTQSPVTPAGTASARFDPDALYQMKIDNTGDAVEDLVIQFQFDGTDNQRVAMYGPAAPVTTGMRNRLISSDPDLSGALGTTLTSGSGATQVQLFAGPRDDPFFIDLEQFFRILPDRRPSQGPASTITQSAGAFRPVNPASPGPFDPAHGAAVDFLSGINTMAIVVELPESMLRGSAPNGTVGIWTTVSR